MKAITAVPETVREVFSKRYIIPDFQRPYSWEGEQCEKLWDDFLEFFDEKEIDDRYFLGNIVITPISGEAHDAWEVVDGQQRLTTLLLLIKALHSRAGTVRALEECLRIKDPLTSALTDRLRVTSNVLEDDRENLYKVIMSRMDNRPKNRFDENYRLFCEIIDLWWEDSGQTVGAMNELILTLLDHIVLLPIHCGSEDDALTIFETINNRGMSLSDADIFKAKLYHNLPQPSQAAFIETWNLLDDHDRLFRILMHILRAQAGVTAREMAMRSFFIAKNNPLYEGARIMDSLQIIHAIDQGWRGNDEINCLWKILDAYSTQYSGYPLFVYLHKYGQIHPRSGEFELPEERVKAFTQLLEATLRYFFIKGTVNASVTLAVKDTISKVCADIERERDYIGIYEANISQSDLENFSALLRNNPLKRGMLSGFVLLAAYLNPAQNIKIYSAFLDSKFDIEHILPKKWNHYDGWTGESHASHLNLLGNLVPLSKSLNIAAKNEYFDRKKVEYKKSSVRDARDLVKVSDWTPEALQRKHDEKVNRILTYFRIQA